MILKGDDPDPTMSDLRNVSEHVKPVDAAGMNERPGKDDESLKALQDEIFIDKVLRARRRSIGEKFLDGPRLFDVVCERMRNGIRSQYPDCTAERVEAELQRRLVIRRRIDEAGIYQNAGLLNE